MPRTYKPTGNPTGRPKTAINKVEFEKLCAIQCTLEEIAGWFGCSHDTIERWCHQEYGDRFANVYAQKRSIGKTSIRRRQFQVAEKGNTSMLIWLGKQYLGQRETAEIKVDQTTDESIKKMDDFFKSKQQEESAE